MANNPYLLNDIYKIDKPWIKLSEYQNSSSMVGSGITTVPAKFRNVFKTIDEMYEKVTIRIQSTINLYFNCAFNFIPYDAFSPLIKENIKLAIFDIFDSILTGRLPINSNVENVYVNNTQGYTLTNNFRNDSNYFTDLFTPQAWAYLKKTGLVNRIVFKSREEMLDFYLDQHDPSAIVTQQQLADVIALLDFNNMEILEQISNIVNSTIEQQDILKRMIDDLKLKVENIADDPEFIDKLVKDPHFQSVNNQLITLTQLNKEVLQKINDTDADLLAFKHSFGSLNEFLTELDKRTSALEAVEHKIDLATLVSSLGGFELLDQLPTPEMILNRFNEINKISIPLSEIDITNITKTNATLTIKLSKEFKGKLVVNFEILDNRIDISYAKNALGVIDYTGTIDKNKLLSLFNSINGYSFTFSDVSIDSITTTQAIIKAINTSMVKGSTIIHYTLNDTRFDLSKIEAKDYGKFTEGSIDPLLNKFITDNQISVSLDVFKTNVEISSSIINSTRNIHEVVLKANNDSTLFVGKSSFTYQGDFIDKGEWEKYNPFIWFNAGSKDYQESLANILSLPENLFNWEINNNQETGKEFFKRIYNIDVPNYITYKFSGFKDLVIKIIFNENVIRVDGSAEDISGFIVGTICLPQAISKNYEFTYEKNAMYKPFAKGNIHDINQQLMVDMMDLVANDEKYQGILNYINDFDLSGISNFKETKDWLKLRNLTLLDEDTKETEKAWEIIDIG